MRQTRKITLALGALVLLLIAVMLVLGNVLGDRLGARLKSGINESLAARVDWADADLGIFRDFPNVSLTLERFSIVGTGPFDGDTLAAARRARLVLDAGSAYRFWRRGEPIIIRELALEEPRVILSVLEDGTANWHITRPDETASQDTSRFVGISLRDLRVTDGALRVDNQRTSLQASLRGLDWSLSGDFARDSFTLATRTRADAVSLRFAGVPYLAGTEVEFNSDIDANLRAQRFTFSDDTLRLNALLLAFTGSVTTSEPATALDLTFSAPSTDFREILSLVPAIYSQDFDRLQTRGRMAVSGRVSGAYGPGAFPALALRANVEEGAFKYPSLPLPARDISLDLAIDNPGGHVDSTVIDLSRFHATIGGRSLDGRLVMRTPVADPDLDLRLVGSLNHADLARTVKLENVTELAGLLATDVAMRARISDFDAGRYDRVAARGTIDISDVAFRSSAIRHPIAIDTGALRLTPRTAELTAFTAKIGASDLRATGSLDNLLRFALRDDEMRGRATVRSTHFDLNEWRSEEETSDVVQVPRRVDFVLDASAERLIYGDITATDVRGALRVKDQRVTLDNLRMALLRGTVVANGFYETTVPAKPVFDVDLRLAAVDIPVAFTTLTTVQKLAPIARWVQGTVSGSVGMRGALGEDMIPDFTALTGTGTIRTGPLAVRDAPIFQKLADALSLEQLRNPALSALQASIAIADGRLHVSPFTVRVNDIDMTVTGSNGIDQSLAYDVGIALPRASLGTAASRTVERLASQAGRAGVDLSAGEIVQLRAQIGGTVTNPAVTVDFVGMAASAREAAAAAAKQAVATRAEEVREHVDSAAEEARRRAQAEAARVVEAAERQAATIRAEARTLAETIRRQGHQRADSLLARATNPAARIAAQAATDRLRREADQRADQLIREADARADAVVAEARRQAASLAPAGS